MASNMKRIMESGQGKKEDGTEGGISADFAIWIISIVKII